MPDAVFHFLHIPETPLSHFAHYQHRTQHLLAMSYKESHAEKYIFLITRK